MVQNAYMTACFALFDTQVKGIRIQQWTPIPLPCLLKEFKRLSYITWIYFI